MFIVNFVVKDLNGGIDKMTIEEAIEKQIPKRPAVLKIDELSGFKYGDCICGTNSWSYEYSIFELVRLYKTFDWENDNLVLMGW